MVRDLDVFMAFVAVVEHGSMTAAARGLGRSVQAVSRDIARLERDLGVTLIARTTRSHRVTAAGQAFCARVTALLQGIDAACDEVRDRETALSGKLRIASSSLFGPHVLMPILAAFMDKHPAITARLELTDAYIDPVMSGADLTIRIGDTDTRAIARKLGELRQVTVAAPAYLARFGRPRRPRELAHHRCIVRRGATESARWTFRVRGPDAQIDVGGVFETDNVAAANQAIELGLGIGRTAFWQVRAAIEAGRLEILLAEFEPARRPVHALWRPGAPLPARARAFLDFVTRRLASEPL